MKRRYLLEFVIFVHVLAVAFVVAPVGAQERAVADDLSTYLEPEALRELLAADLENVYLVDVRTAAEYEAGHIPGAIHRDYREIPVRPPVDERDAVVIVYCRTGSRSRVAEMMLGALGYERVLDWGGIIRWPYEVVTGSSPDGE